MELQLLVEQIELSSNDFANYIFEEITIEILSTVLVIILFLLFANLALSLLKNI